MPQVIKPVKTQVVTKEGECAVDIAIELTINVNSDGLQVSATAAPGPADEDDETLWAIPKFGGGHQVKFGKTEKCE